MFMLSTLNRRVQTRGRHKVCDVAVLKILYCGDAANKISNCGVAVISNPTVCDVCVFHTAVFGVMKLFAVMGCFDFLCQTYI